MQEKLTSFLVEDGIQSLLAVAIIGTVIVISAMGNPVSELLDTLAKIIVPFYFGSKVGGLAQRARMMSQQ